MSRTCPWWFGYFLLFPMRRLAQRPTRILSPFVRPGVRVVEPGPNKVALLVKSAA